MSRRNRRATSCSSFLILSRFVRSSGLPADSQAGQREPAGYKGRTGDRVVRAISIATGKPYQEVYEAINLLAKNEHPRNGRKRSSARSGVWRKTYHAYLASLGWRWIPTMAIGSGCKVHLRADELPGGRLIVRLSKHVCAVIDRVIHDTHNPLEKRWMSSDEQGKAIVLDRCVYGYFIKESV